MESYSRPEDLGDNFIEYRGMADMVHLNKKNYSGVKTRKGNVEAVLETNSEAEYTYDVGQASAEDFGSLQQQVSD